MKKVAICQMEVIPGSIQKNVDTIIHYINEAKEKHADIVVFPELCVTGYTIGDRFNDHYFCNEAMEANDTIRDATKDITAIWGNIHYGTFHSIEKGRDGRPLRLNCAFIAKNGKYVERNGLYGYMYVKSLNPDYRIFDESRYFLSAIELNAYGIKQSDNEIPFVVEGEVIGLEICEDLWSGDYSYDITSKYVETCNYIFNLSSSLWTKNKEIGRAKRVKMHASHHPLPYLFYVNHVGIQNNGKNVCVYDGGSTVYDANGEAYFELNDEFKEELAFFDGQKKLNETCKDKLKKALVYGIRKFDEQMFPFQPKWIIGLSGGLDSSINVALLVEALGKDRVIGYNLATKYNSNTTKSNAYNEAKVLGIEYRDGFISPLVDATKEVVYNYQYTDEQISSLTEENIQARIRGHVLSTFAAMNNGVICNNGNKVEVALGYLTLYGDSIGAICPIGDLTKKELFDLAHMINEEKEIVPYSLLPEIIDGKIQWIMPPSAELKNAQVDPMKWYYHDALIEYLTTFPNYGIEKFVEQYLQDKLQSNENYAHWITYYGLDDVNEFFKDLEWLLNTINRNVYKRIQLPPNIIVSRGAYGYDLRESQMNLPYSKKYQDLKKQCFEKWGMNQ